MTMKKRWKLKPANRELQDFLGRELNILPVTAQLLINRGLEDKDKALSFLSPDVQNLHDPFLMKDMDKAVERVAKAVAANEKICIYGDYDVDGTTSTALLYLFFKECGIDVLTRIPERKHEGYGLNKAAIDELRTQGVKLLITVDCGSSNAVEVEHAGSVGIDVIITDHHEIGEVLPKACAFVNPKREGCAFPFKGLAGVGVAFNFAIALRSKFRDNGHFKDSAVPNLRKYLDLAAVGTIADMVPLVDENRIIASFGLKELDTTSRPGLKALKEAAGIRRGKLTSDSIAFQIAPRINAAGRIERADTALRLLVTDDEKEAAELALKLNMVNVERQEIEFRTLNEALEMLGGEPKERAIVLASDRWNQGVIGIVASKLVDRFSRPTILIALENGIGKGSVRGVNSLNVLEGLQACEKYLERFGGHRAAAGVTLKSENFDAFKTAYLEYVDKNLTEDELAPELRLDCVVAFDEVSPRLVNELEMLSPFGRSNEKPLLCAERAEVIKSDVVRDKHLKMLLKQKNRTQSAIAYNMGAKHPVSGGYDIAFSPYIDDWNGNSSVCFKVKEMRPSK